MSTTINIDSMSTGEIAYLIGYQASKEVSNICDDFNTWSPICPFTLQDRHIKRRSEFIQDVNILDEDLNGVIRNKMIEMFEDIKEELN